MLAGGCLLATILTLWLTWGIWKTGAVSGDDSTAHLVRADYALRHLFPRGKIDGWQTSFGLGYQEFLFIGPGFTLAVGLIKVLSLGTLSTLTAFKVAIVLTYVGLPLAVAFLAWAFELGRKAGGVAAVLTLLVSNPFGGAGLVAVFQTGLVANQFGSLFVCLTLAALLLVLRRPTRRRVVFAALATAGLVVSHGVAAIIVAIFAVALLLSAGIEWLTLNHAVLGGAFRARVERARSASAERQDEPGVQQLALFPATRFTVLRPVRQRVEALAGAAALAAGLSAFVLLPVVAHRGLRGENSAWADLPLGERLAQMWHGQFLFRPWTFVFVLAGIGFLAGRAARRPFGLTVLLTPFVFLLISRTFIHLDPHNILAVHLTNRSFGYIGLLAVLPLALLIASASDRLARLRPAGSQNPHDTSNIREPMRLRRARSLAGAFIPLVLAVALVLAPPHLDRDQPRVVRPTPAFSHAAEALARVVPPAARFVTQREPAREAELTGMTHPDFWMPWATGRDTLDIFNIESSKVFGPVYEGEHLGEGNPEAKAGVLARLGVSHVLLIDIAAAPALLTSTLFRVVWQEGTMAILAVRVPAGSPPAASLLSASVPVRATMTHPDSQRFRFCVRADQPITASLAIGWSPKWKATVNGRTTRLGQNRDHLLALHLPAGASEVDLRFASDRWDVTGRLVTVLSMAVLVWLLLGLLRERRPPPKHGDRAGRSSQV